MGRTNYRPTRNIEKSIIDKITEILAENDWEDTNVEVVFAKVYETENCTILITVNDESFNSIEIGDNVTQRIVQIIYDIYATSDSQLRDLKDILLDDLKHGIPYYEYTINKQTGQDAEIEARTRNGTLSPQFPLISRPANLNVENKSSLNVKDRYRWRITISYKWSVLEE